MSEQHPVRIPRPSADLTRERILDAALEVFAERSFDGASTRGIAHRAEVTQPLLTYHFTTKVELWRAAVDRLFALLAATLDDRLRGLRGVDEVTVVRLVLREFIFFSARHPELHRIITAECRSETPRMDWLVERHVRPLYERLVTGFERLAAEGHLPAIPVAHLYYIVTGAGATMFVLGPECKRLTGLDPSSEEVIEAHADAVTTLLLGPRGRST